MYLKEEKIELDNINFMKNIEFFKNGSFLIYYSNRLKLNVTLGDRTFIVSVNGFNIYVSGYRNDVFIGDIVIKIEEDESVKGDPRFSSLSKCTADHINLILDVRFNDKSNKSAKTKIAISDFVSIEGADTLGSANFKISHHEKGRDGVSLNLSLSLSKSVKNGKNFYSPHIDFNISDIPFENSKEAMLKYSSWLKKASVAIEAEAHSGIFDKFDLVCEK